MKLKMMKRLKMMEKKRSRCTDEGVFIYL